MKKTMLSKKTEGGEEGRSPGCVAFANGERIAQGDLIKVAAKVKQFVDKNPETSVLVFDDWTSAAVEFDLRGSQEEVLARLRDAGGEAQEKTGPGRPKLGVVSREIGLLPRHWEWLSLQPGGASVTLRKLVEEAKKQNHRQDAVRRSQNAAYKFMSAMAGDLPHFEEASRAFFAKNKALFETLSAGWPKDIRSHSLVLAQDAWE